MLTMTGPLPQALEDQATEIKERIAEIDRRARAEAEPLLRMLGDLESLRAPIIIFEKGEVPAHLNLAGIN